MANAILLHGTGGSPSDFWFPWLSQLLGENGISVWAPQLPQAEDPQLSVSLPFVLEHGKFSENTILVGHSSGASLILGILEQVPVRVRQAILVSGFASPLSSGTGSGMLKSSYGWERIRSHVSDLIFINSDNDPFECDQRQAQAMFDKLGGTMIIRHGEGHMGSKSWNQPYREFPMLKKLILG